jgi:hypothetical protein
MINFKKISIQKINIKKASLPDDLVLFAALLFLYTTALGGVLRYLLISVHLGGLIYLPKALILATTVLLIAVILSRRKASRTLLGWLALFAFSSFLGLMYTHNLAQVAFGLWTLAPFIFAIVAYPSLVKNWQALRRHLALLWLLAIVGVGLALIVQLPWAGYAYNFQGIAFQSSRLWYTTGIQRLAGFSRASFDAATQVVLLGSLIVTTARNRLWRTAAWLLSGAAIAVTTSKTVALIFLVITLFLLGRRFLPKVFWVFLAVLITLLMVCLPLSTLLINYDVNTSSTLGHFLFSSFGDRLSNTWPRALALINGHGNIVLGRGLGGMGTPLSLFEPRLATPADNLFIYLYGIFGVVSLFVLAMLNAMAGKLDFRKNHFDAFMYAVILITLLWGMTSSTLETAFVSFFLGLTMRYCSNLLSGRASTHSRTLRRST